VNIHKLPRYVKQPTSIIAQNKRLIFVYPFIIDESLNKYSDILRDFFTVVFTGEIKISNILHVVSTNFQTPTLTDQKYTPAEQLYRRLSGQDVGFGYYGPPESKKEEQEKQRQLDRYQLDAYIKKQLQFIKKYIETNPRYKKFRPCVSTITIPGEIFVNIPLIIGTQPYFVDPQVTYWILLLAIGLGLTLNDSRSFSEITNRLRSLNEEQFYELVFREEGQRELERRMNIRSNANVPARTQAISRLMNEVFDDIKKTTTFFNIVLNPSRWDEYNGVLTRDNVFQTAVNRVRPAYSSDLLEAQSLFSSFVSNEVVSILNSYANIMEPATSSSAALISQFVDTITSPTTLNMTQMGTVVIDNLQSAIKDTDAAENVLKILSQMCKQLEQVKVDRLLIDLNSKRVSAAYMSFDEVANFHNDVEAIAQKLGGIAKNIENSFHDVIVYNAKGQSSSSDHLLRYFANFKRTIEEKIDDLFFKDDPRFGKLLEEPSENKHPRWAAVNGEQELSQDSYKTLVQVANDAKIIISNLIYFFYMYTFASFVCKSIETIKMEVKTVKNDATDFPNYCMVIRAEIIKALYMVLHIRNFKQALKDPDQIQSIKQQYARWSPSQNQVKQMVNYIRDRLEVPNIIAVDERKNEIYYRFMFMDNAEKVRLSTINTYIKTQHDLLIVK